MNTLHVRFHRYASLGILLLAACAPSVHADRGTPAPHVSPVAAVAPAKPETAATRAETPSKKHGSQHDMSGLVNLNQADQAALELLPGVGEKKADRIVLFRRSHPFKKVEDLTKVRGFGRKTLSRLRPYLSTTGPSTLGTLGAGEPASDAAARAAGEAAPK